MPLDTNLPLLVVVVVVTPVIPATPVMVVLVGTTEAEAVEVGVL